MNLKRQFYFLFSVFRFFNVLLVISAAVVLAIILLAFPFADEFPAQGVQL